MESGDGDEPGGGRGIRIGPLANLAGVFTAWTPAASTTFGKKWT
jgi:hypothetical protein